MEDERGQAMSLGEVVGLEGFLTEALEWDWHGRLLASEPSGKLKLAQLVT